MKKILIIGGYSCKNPGDEAILKSTIYRIKEFFPDAFFYIWTDQRNFTLNFDREIPFEIIHWNIFPDILRVKKLNAVLRAFYNNFFPFSRYLLAPFFSNEKFNKVVLDCNAVIAVGGGYLTSHYSVKEINYLANTVKRLNKPFYLIGQTLGPFYRKYHLLMADEIFQYADKIVIRDVDSMSEVYRYKQKVTIGSDDAILFEPNNKKVDEFLENSLLRPSNSELTLNIGFNLRIWGDSRESYPQLARSLSKITALLPEYKIRFVFVPMEVSNNCDDRIEGRYFYGLLDKQIDFVILENPLTVEQIYGLIGHLDFFIGMRLHGLVFALSNAVPSIGLYYEDYYERKIRGLFEVFDFNNYSLMLKEVDNLDQMFYQMFLKKDLFREKLRDQKNKIIEKQREILKEITDCIK